MILTRKNLCVASCLGQCHPHTHSSRHNTQRPMIQHHVCTSDTTSRSRSRSRWNVMKSMHDWLLSISMNLKIQQRESQDNLFVRLHPTTVRQLCKTCSASVARNFSGKVNDTNSWTIQDEVPNDVQFLPLRIKKSDGNWVYCSYNGGFCEKGMFRSMLIGDNVCLLLIPQWRFR